MLAVDLATLRVSDHALSQPISLLGRLRNWLDPPAHAKSIAGPTRYAAWYAGQLVVGGTDYHGLRDGRVEATTHGVKLIDTANWTIKSLDENAGAFSVVANRLLLYGGLYNTRKGVGLDAYDRSGRRVFSLFGDSLVGYVQTAGRYAIVSEQNSTLHRVVDVASGRVLKTIRTREPTTILSAAYR